MESLLIAAASWWFDPANWLAMARAALGLGFVIFVHELGHFLVAKFCGVKCEKFYVGFDPPLKIGPFHLPRTLFRKQWGETEYGIGIIPLGGYVKMLGQDDNPANAEAEAARTKIAVTSSDPPLAGDQPATDGDRANFVLDPRSYPAKTVPQRMAIISAGVIMNMIFAVLFASWAFRIGVNYVPCVIGNVAAGDPAWQAGLRAGDKIVQLGRQGRKDDELRYFKDLVPAVFLTGADADLDILVRAPDQQETWFTTRPMKADKTAKRATIGVHPMSDLRFAQVPAAPGSSAFALRDTLQPGDRVTAIEVQGQLHPVENFVQLQARLEQSAQLPVTLHLERTGKNAASGTTLQVTVPPQPRQGLGCFPAIGPITALRKGSPADQAGLLPQDLIQKIDGQPVGDPLRIEAYMHAHVGQSVVITVQRGNQPIDVTVQPQATGLPNAASLRPSSSVASDSIGIAYRVENALSSVDPQGPAARAGLQPGDVVSKIVLRPQLPSGIKAEAEPYQAFAALQKFDFSADLPCWPYMMHFLQELASPQVEVEYLRNGKLASCKFEAVTETDAYHPQRGLIFDELQANKKAASWSEAFHLGWRETWESAGMVWTVLKRLTRTETLNNLGGPLTIGYSATMEASRGFAELLTFLTALSANLAVVNLLPIPVLDGGHLVFLLWEGIFRKPLNERIVMGLTFAGLVLILGLMLFVIGKDFFTFFQMFVRG